LPPGRARLSTKPAPTGSVTFASGAGRLLQRSHVGGATGQDDVWREREPPRICE
jgi:hypothetical protein